MFCMPLHDINDVHHFVFEVLSINYQELDHYSYEILAICKIL